MFQFTPLREGWLHAVLHLPFFAPVSIHTPTWGVTFYGQNDVFIIVKFQFTPLREGWLSQKMLYEDERQVSIHTPTWGVTILDRWLHLCHCVSIHTPTWGVTIMRRYSLVLEPVSIHTPTWGVTANLYKFLLNISENCTKYKKFYLLFIKIIFSSQFKQTNLPITALKHQIILRERSGVFCTGPVRADIAHRIKSLSCSINSGFPRKEIFDS